MVRRSPQKRKNPYIGSHTIQLGNRRKRLTKYFSKAFFFRQVFKSRRYGKWLSFEPSKAWKKRTGRKQFTVDQKKAIVYGFLVKDYTNRENKKAQERERYAARRKAKGKGYTARKPEIKESHEIIGISKRSFETIRKKFPRNVKTTQALLKKAEKIVYTESSKVFEKRYVRFRSKIKQEFREAKAAPDLILGMSESFSPASFGSGTPSGHGQRGNWADFQERLGIDYKESIIWNVTRYIRALGTDWFKEIVEGYSRGRRKPKRLIFGFTIMTNVEGEEKIKRPIMEIGKLPTIWVNNKDLWTKKWWDKFQWSFVQSFFNTLYGVGVTDNSGPNFLTSSGVHFRQRLEPTKSRGATVKRTRNFKVGYMAHLTKVYY